MAGIKQPNDKSYFILPDLGEGVHEAELVKWRVKPGDTVDEHQTLAEMETDKALVEVPSPWAGVVSELHGSEGEILNVGNKLVSYKVAGGSSSAAKAQAAEPKPAAASGAEEREDAGTVVGSMGAELTISQRFARRELEHAGAATSGSKALATPAVRRIARELGVDINHIDGTGRGGRVTASDVEAFAGSGSPASTPAPARQRDLLETATRAPSHYKTTPAAVADGIAERIAFRGVRRKIAESLHRSITTAVHFTVVDEADVTALDKKRLEYSAVLGRKLSFLPFILTAVCQALHTHSTLNANVDDENQEILLKAVVNLGIAVDTDHGLMVPVVHHADQKSLVQLAESVSELAAGARSRTIDREKLMGGTFTVSNVGSYGGRFATPIINYPEVAILAAGRVYEKVLTRDGMFYAGKVLPLSMSCDHRVVDGAEGARFLNTVVTLLQNPEQMLRDR